MRAVLICFGMVLSSGCSVLDQLALNGERTLDPSRAYLSGKEQIRVHRQEVADYACISGPLMCRNMGVDYECRCANAW